jgi:hypothetical protein
VNTSGVRNPHKKKSGGIKSGKGGGKAHYHCAKSHDPNKFFKE